LKEGGRKREIKRSQRRNGRKSRIRISDKKGVMDHLLLSLGKSSKISDVKVTPASKKSLQERKGEVLRGGRRKKGASRGG